MRLTMLIGVTAESQKVSYGDEFGIKFKVNADEMWRMIPNCTEKLDGHN